MPSPFVVQVPGVTTPKAIYDALRNQRRELNNQIDEVESARREVASQLRDGGLSDADKAGLQQRLATLDQRLASLDLQKAEADQAVAKQAAIPGSIVPDAPRVQTGVPDEVFFLTGLFMVVVLLPVSLAFARRVWRRSSPAVATLPQELYDRFTRVEQSLDTIAIEVERVGEGQRFLTRMQAQQADRPLAPGAAEHVNVPVRDKARDARK